VAALTMEREGRREGRRERREALSVAEAVIRRLR
jgi:hypothetical protein